MPKEMIRTIQNAEAQANAIRADGAEEAKKRIREAERDAELLCERAEAEATETAAELLRLTREKTEESLAESRRRAREEAERLTAEAERFMRDTVRWIVQEVFEACR